MTRRKELMEQYEVEEDTIFLENPDFDGAIIGISNGGAVVYDYRKMIECLTEVGKGTRYEMTEEEAIDWIDYNTLRAIPYMNGIQPVIVYNLETF